LAIIVGRKGGKISRAVAPVRAWSSKEKVTISYLFLFSRKKESFSCIPLLLISLQRGNSGLSFLLPFFSEKGGGKRACPPWSIIGGPPFQKEGRSSLLLFSAERGRKRDLSDSIHLLIIFFGEEEGEG